MMKKRQKKKILQSWLNNIEEKQKQFQEQKNMKQNGSNNNK